MLYTRGPPRKGEPTAGGGRQHDEKIPSMACSCSRRRRCACRARVASRARPRAGSLGDARNVLRRVPQLARSCRGAELRGAQRGVRPRARGSLRGRRDEAPRPSDAAARQPATRAAGDRRAHRLARALARRRHGAARRGLRSGAAPEPHGVCARGAGPPRRGHRPGGAPAGRNRGGRLYEHRGGAFVLARVRRAIRERREHGCAPRSRRAAAESRHGILPAADRGSGRVRRRDAARHARRCAVHACLPG